MAGPALSILYANRAAAHIKLGDWDAARDDACDALRHDPRNVKAFARRAAASANLGTCMADTAFQSDLHEIMGLLPGTNLDGNAFSQALQTVLDVLKGGTNVDTDIVQTLEYAIRTAAPTVMQAGGIGGHGASRPAAPVPPAPPAGQQHPSRASMPAAAARAAKGAGSSGAGSSSTGASAISPLASPANAAPGAAASKVGGRGSGGAGAGVRTAAAGGDAAGSGSSASASARVYLGHLRRAHPITSTSSKRSQANR